MVLRGALLALVALGQFASATGLAALQPAVAEAEATSSVDGADSPIRKVITLIEEMKAQVDKDAVDDQRAHDKYMCWCKTNEEAKTQAIADAERRIDELTSLLEELAATESRLKTEIAGLAQDIADDQDALATATAMRAKEFAAFQAEETDLKDTIGLLKEAVAVLSNVQLLQKQGGGMELAEASRARAALVQLQSKVERRGHPDFFNVLKRDLFDVLGSFADSAPTSAFLPKKYAAFVESRGSLLPWEKTDEQVGAEAKPNELEGSAANAKSYNSRSGRILGLLEEMQEETSRDLAEAQGDDANAEANFQKLRAAKLDEIAIATKQKKRKERQLSDTIVQAAKSKKDRESTQDALSADETFLANMLKDCKVEDEEYNKRRQIRSDEAVAIAETLKILTEDDARDLYAKTVSLVQLSGTRQMESLQAGEQERRATRSMQRIAAVARKHNNWALVSLAVRMRLDAFTKVKEALDKMLAELAKQQKEEYAHWETCKSNIDQTEDDIKVGEQTKEDLSEKRQSLVNTMDTLAREIAALKQEEADMEVSLKQAGELRKEQNHVYQTSVMDQRATTNILNKALARLKQFYQTKSLLQINSHQPENQPGRAVAPPSPKGRDYFKSGGAGGVIQLLMKIIENSEVEEQQLNQDEQQSQKLYAEFVAATTATIEADRAAIQEKSIRLSEAKGAKSDTEEELLANGNQLAKLGDLLKAHHLDCDYLIKYFDIRQQARAEEMDAITDAKAVLSGSDFAA